MPKKSKRIKRKAADISLRLAMIVLGVFLLFILTSVFLWRNSVSFCANSISCIKDLSGKPEPDNKGLFMGQTVYAPSTPNTPSYEIAQAKSVLGATTDNQKHIYVSLDTQLLYAYEGTTLYMKVPISSGKWHPTPTGDFHIWIWLRATRMTGGSTSNGTYYDLPNVPYTMYFYNDQIAKYEGYSIHGAYWHNNFGHPMSHGCVNMRIPDAQQLYYWSNPAISGWGTYATADNLGPTITIYGSAPAGETAFVD